MKYTCDSLRGASDVRYSRCRNRPRVDDGLSVGISVTVSVSSNKVRVVVVFTKKRCLGRPSPLVGCQASGKLIACKLIKPVAFFSELNSFLKDCIKVQEKEKKVVVLCSRPPQNVMN